MGRKKKKKKKKEENERMEAEKLRERSGDEKEINTNKITHKSKFHYFFVFNFYYNFVIFKIDKFIFLS